MINQYQSACITYPIVFVQTLGALSISISMHMLNRELPGISFDLFQANWLSSVLPHEEESLFFFFFSLIELDFLFLRLWRMLSRYEQQGSEHLN